MTDRSPRGQWINEPSDVNTLRHVDGLVQERRNSSALVMELRLSCTNPSMYIWCWPHIKHKCSANAFIEA